MTEEEAKENERSPSVVLVRSVLLRKGIVYELERECDGFVSIILVTYDAALL